jgi:cell wall-associated NlpC family hydrolase
MRLTAFVCATCAVVLAAAAPAAAAQRYTIAEHDTLDSISRQFGVSVARLAQVNQIRDPERIRAGAILVIPDPRSGTHAVHAAAAPSGRPVPSRPTMTFTYVVRPGDTLSRLARAYGLTVPALLRANGLASPHYISVGQALRIPGPARESPETVAVHLLPVRLYVTPAPESEHRGPAPVPIRQARAQLIQQITAQAREFVGTPYAWAGTSRSGLDCSGLVYLLYSPYVVDLPRGSYGQFAVGQRVSRQDLQPGDLVFFATYASGPSHVGIYLGDERFVSANVPKVIIKRLDEPYWAVRYVGARRLI